MKTYVIIFIAISYVFSFNCFGQRNGNALVITENDNASKEGLVIAGYYVEETINMSFGKRITKYEVSRLSMVSTNDLGPNNTRVVTPIYRKAKIKPTEVAGLKSKTLADNGIETTIKPVKVEVAATKPERPKYVIVDVVGTYANVLDKGYESIDMLMKVADRSYFDGDLALAAKYYAQLFNVATNLDAMYYYRYAQSLKATNQTKKADEMMKIFESKNSSSKITKE